MKQIPETIVLIETAKWLVKKGYDLNSISIPKGKGYTGNIKSIIEKELKNIGYDKRIDYNPNGADIIAQNQDEIWKIECKGLSSSDEPGTHKNNFDRALASVVTYFDSENKKQILALAIPNSLFYLQHLSRISKPLRKILNLWILLIDESKHTIIDYKPDADDSDIKRVTEQRKDKDKALKRALKKALRKDPELLKKINECHIK